MSRQPIIEIIRTADNPQVLEARLRYSMDKGQVAFRFVVPGIEKAERDAFRSFGEHVREKTGVPVYYVA